MVFEQLEEGGKSSLAKNRGKDSSRHKEHQRQNKECLRNKEAASVVGHRVGGRVGVDARARPRGSADFIPHVVKGSEQVV